MNNVDMLATVVVCFGVYLLVTKLSGPSPYEAMQKVHRYAESKGWVVTWEGVTWEGVIHSTYRKGCIEVTLIPHAGLEHNKSIIDNAEDSIYRESKLAQNYMEILNG